MPILLPSSGIGLTRDATWFDPASDWTRAFWVRFNAAASGVGFVVWILGDVTYSGPYISIGTGGVADQNIYLNANPGSGDVATNPYPISANVWTYYTATYEADITTLRLYVDGVLVESVVVDLSAMAAQADEHLGTDLTSIGNLDLAYERAWQVALTATEIMLERASESALQTADLLASSPLPTASDLADESGNQHDWTAIGSVQTYGGSGPLPLTPTATICAFLTCDIPECLPILDP